MFHIAPLGAHAMNGMACLLQAYGRFWHAAVVSLMAACASNPDFAP